ncbi:tyrosine-protein phosphatase [Microbacterium sp. P5_E9]
MQLPIIVDGLANVRDLGGLERNDGSLTPTGVFLRSEMLDRLSGSGWQALRDYGVRTVIDLRRENETTGDVPDDIRLVHVDLDGDEPEFWAPFEADGRWGTPLYYIAHVHELPHRLAEVLHVIASAPDGAVLIHCSAGWDRTGLVAAVLLKALDVTANAAVNDYLESFVNAEAMAALHGRSFHIEERREVLQRFGHTADSAYRGMYGALDLDEWFRIAAIDDETRTAIRTWRGSTDHD